MPYNSPTSSSSSTTTTAVLIPMSSPQQQPSSPTRNHRRSFTDEHGPGAFAPLSGLPKRRPTTGPGASSSSSSISGNKFAFPSTTSPIIRPTSPSSTKSPKFQLKADDDSDDTDEDDDTDRRGVTTTISVGAVGRSSPAAALNGRTVGDVEATPPLIICTSNDVDNDDVEEQEDVRVAVKVPFPTSSRNSPPSSTVQRSASSPHISSPTCQTPPPSIYRSPHFSGPRDPSTRRSQPLKPALKTNHSSPHLPSLAHQRTLTQSAPSTPNIPKTAWITPPGSTPGSGATTPLPSTPKSVHFASEKSSLESVVLFTKSARPRSLSNPMEPDTETETERENNAPSIWGTPRSGYPFPVMPDQIVTLNEKDTSPIPAESAIGMNGMDPTNVGERRMVYLETLNLPAQKPPALRGSVLVRNLAFQKRVAIRFTLDDWQTTSEVTATYSASLPNLPPPFSSHAPTSGHTRSATMSSGGAPTPPTTPAASDRWDRFTFTIKLEDMERSLAHKKIYLVICYQLPSQWGWESGGEWWDNNDGKNYSASFKMISPPNPAGAKKVGADAHKRSTSLGGEDSKPMGLAARTAASLNATVAGDDDEAPSPSSSQPSPYNFPPLPPPGPIRSTGSTVNGPSTHKAQIKPKPLSLATGPKLRPGRMETFTSGGKASPPGSPTTYTPPVPGAVPTNVGRRVGGSLECLPSFFGAKLDGGHVSSSEDLTAYGRARGAAFGVPPAPPKSHGLKINTTSEPSPPAPTLSPSKEDEPAVVATPTTIITGKKRGLSLSNYCSPSSISPTNVKSPTSHTAAGGPISMQSLIPSPQHKWNASTGSPVTPLVDFKIVGGMPATVLDEPVETTGHLNRVASWDERAQGGWLGVPDVRNGASPPATSTVPQDVEELKKPVAGLQKDLPSSTLVGSEIQHAQELSGDSTLSTPDLERSPEQEQRSVDSSASTTDEDEDVAKALDKKLNLQASSSGFNSDTDLPGNRSDDSSATQTPQQNDSLGSSSIPFPSGSPELSTVGPSQLSSLGRRTSSQTGVQMKLDLPSRPIFKERPSNKKVQPIDEAPKIPSPPAVTVSGKLRAERQAHFRTSPPPSPPDDATDSAGLGLNVISPSGTVSGPPAEFLAKYCFFVSSPSTSPPTSSGVASPAMSPPFGLGVDTPRASSPGLASSAGPSAWWGGMSMGRPEEKEKNGVTAGST